jgi:hypothetical protein
MHLNLKQSEVDTEMGTAMGPWERKSACASVVSVCIKK